jgi:hypothetical protein
MAHAERWAARIGGPAFAIDDQTSIRMANGKGELILRGIGRTSAREGFGSGIVCSGRSGSSADQG